MRDDLLEVVCSGVTLDCGSVEDFKGFHDAQFFQVPLYISLEVKDGNIRLLASPYEGYKGEK